MRPAALWLALGLSGCASYTQLPPAERAGITRALSSDPRRFLRVSFHLTPFFGDRTRRLLTDVPPELVRLMEQPDGTAVNPGPILDTVPAGTPVRILEVAFPTALEVGARAAFTPRDRPWVMVQLEGQPLPAALVMPRHFRSQAEFMGELERYLSAHDPAPQLQALNPRIQEAVRSKAVVLDMGAAAVEMAWGYPERKLVSYAQGGRDEAWSYAGGLRVVHLRDGRVVRWEPDRDQRR